jgi:hypothetical protein
MFVVGRVLARARISVLGAALATLLDHTFISKFDIRVDL